MEKCQYHDELSSIVKEIREDVGEIKEKQASIDTTLGLLVEGKLRFNGKTNGDKNDKVALAALEIAKIAVAALAGGTVAGLWVKNGTAVMDLLLDVISFM